MKKLLVFFCIIFLLFFLYSFILTQSSLLNNIEGTYQGTLSIGSSDLRLALVISKNLFDFNKLDAILISIDQGGSMIGATSFNSDNSSITFNFDNIKAKIIILESNNDKLKTIFTQGKVKSEIIFSKIPRPQQPIPPFEYEQKEVKINNQDIILNGTLTIPSNKAFSQDGKLPAIVLITGSGAQNRDEEIFSHKPFLVISDFLTKNGFCVLRVDDRGVGQDSKIISNSDTFDFVQDAISEVNYLKNLEFIDKTRIGILGHSEGGLISFILASNYPDDIAFIISLAGPSLRGDKLLLSQQEAIARASGAKESDIKKILQINSALYEAVIKHKDDATNDGLINEIKEIAKKYKLSKDDTQAIIYELTSKWIKTFIPLDPADYIKNIKCPSLILFGEKDLQVPAILNSDLMNKILSNTQKEFVKIFILPSCNHLFQTCNTGNIYEYALIKETISESTLNIIKEFLLTIKK